MKKLILSLICVGTIAFAQEFQEIQASPRQTIKQDFSVTSVTVDYSRPSMNERKIMGELVPFDKVWRFGANAATIISFGEDLRFGSTVVKAGKYALFATPTKDTWKILFNLNTDQRGTRDYKESNNAFEIEVKAQEMKNTVQTFQIRFDGISAEKMMMLIEWENTRIEIPVSTADAIGARKISDELKMIREKEREAQQDALQQRTESRAQQAPASKTPSRLQ